MELYTFAKENGKSITNFNSNFMMSRIIQTDKTTHIGCMYLEGNGVIGYHQAVVPQLLLVVSGEGYVRGERKSPLKFNLETLSFGRRMNGMKRKQM